MYTLEREKGQSGVTILEGIGRGFLQSGLFHRAAGGLSGSGIERSKFIHAAEEELQDRNHLCSVIPARPVPIEINHRGGMC